MLHFPASQTKPRTFPSSTGPVYRLLYLSQRKPNFPVSQTKHLGVSLTLLSVSYSIFIPSAKSVGLSFCISLEQGH